MEHISQRDLRNDSAGVLRRVEAGESLTVTRRGVPVADLVPHRDHVRAPSRYPAADRIAEALADVPPWDGDAFAAEQEDLDCRVEDECRDPWTTR